MGKRLPANRAGNVVSDRGARGALELGREFRFECRDSMLPLDEFIDQCGALGTQTFVIFEKKFHRLFKALKVKWR